MYISKQQLESRLDGLEKIESKDAPSSDNRPFKRVEVVEHKGGRPAGSKSIPPETRALIGALAKTDTQENVAEEFGVSQSLVSKASRGLVDNQLITPETEEESKNIKGRIASAALDTLMDSIGLLAEDVTKKDRKAAINSSIVAKNLAIIADKMVPKDNSEGGGFSPRILININGAIRKEEKDYETVSVTAVAS